MTATPFTTDSSTRSDHVVASAGANRAVAGADHALASAGTNHIVASADADHAVADHAPAMVIEIVFDGATPPKRATRESAGYDLCAYLDRRAVSRSDGAREWTAAADERDGRYGIDLAPGEMALVPLGFKARLPSGYEAQVRPRSGAAFRRALHIPNAPGTIDADFPDEWMVPVQNGGVGTLRIAHGERIAQMVLHRFDVLPLQHGTVAISTDRAGGFGSTGR